MKVLQSLVSRQTRETGSSLSPFYSDSCKAREWPVGHRLQEAPPWALGSVSELPLTDGETLSRSFRDLVFSREVEMETVPHGGKEFLYHLLSHIPALPLQEWLPGQVSLLPGPGAVAPASFSAVLNAL